MTDPTTTFTCPGCESEVNTDTDCYGISTVDGKEYCEGCREADLGSASTVFLFGPGYEPDSDGPVRFYIGSLFHEDRYAEEPRDFTFSQKYVRTDGWRGYTETSIDGWTEVTTGWTTGDWGDSVSDRKAPFRDWVESLHDGDIDLPCPVAIVCDLTSNVFSTAIGVWVPDENADQFREWINGDLKVLEDALG